MESLDVEPDFNLFQKNINSLPNFYKTSNEHLNLKHEINKNDFYILSSEEVSDILLMLDELNKAIQINIDESHIDNCDEIISILRKPIGQPHQKSVNHKISKKSIFKPLKRPRKIMLKVLRDDSPSKDTQNTNTNCNSKKTAASNTSLKSNCNNINITGKISYETNNKI